MSNRHDIMTYSKLEEGAVFFLRESFHHIHSALSYEFAKILFSEELEKTKLTQNDKTNVKTMKFPSNAVELLQSDVPEPLTENTLQTMSESWQKCQIKAQRGEYKFGLDHRIDSIEILGHLNNFGFFIETLINRHLLFLKQTEVISQFSYARISIAKVMERIIYIFKDELNTNKVHLNEIVSLFSLRNKTVHFTPDNAKALKPKISELIQIWNQSVKIIQKLEKMELFNEEKFSEKLTGHIKDVKERWN